MQLGLPIPFQKFLKLKQPPYGEPIDLIFCWGVHRVTGIGSSTLIAVNASSRYSLVFAGMKAASWKHIDELVISGIKQAMEGDGYTAEQIETYLAAAGPPEFTKTHGRSPVACMNKAIETLGYMEKWLDESQLFQPDITWRLNEDFCHATGFPDESYGNPWKYLFRDLRRLGICEDDYELSRDIAYQLKLAYERAKSTQEWSDRIDRARESLESGKRLYPSDLQYL
ncbi:MAG: hypothetical protein FWD27_01685 [Coriobacteriia bacterium]|nr:hypothetical protein [Coriobacteriia bacterium]